MSNKPAHQRSGAPLGTRFFVTCAAIVLVAGGIVAIRLVPVPDEPVISTAALGNLPGIAGIPATAGGTATPKPWQYDPASNRHWDPRPGHQHWHMGTPPANPDALPSATTTLPPATTTLPTPSMKTPTPWEYDAANDRYWHAEHNHYHPGQPPPPDQR